ncbi:putative MFS family arabinose efflux permease [Chitinophaga japonensis]|uniref:Putative MFS family arabinose efflux permease n=1 Tax=Chitinophaga japonensis TaxID=104662 RepID=A0A562STM7_CHIJA|nr:MFS transporter [Chitinophaga japonensis]TWI84100.1 putative MFS family arabinose efflux permease [Chitinophaga japonensis]
MDVVTSMPVAETRARKGLPAALWALTISAFAIGTTEFVAVGILPTIAQSLHVSISSSGLLVSIYAMGVALGGPILTVLTGKLPRKPLLVGLMGLFIAGHIASALAPSFAALLAARFISGFAHAVFFGVGATIAATLVAPDKKATAIAIMFAGLTIAIIAGVPLGTFIGQHFGWRATFVGVALLGVIGFFATLLLLPGNLKQGPPLRLKDQLQVVRSGPILLVLAITALGYGGTFVTFTYLATLLEKISGFSAGAVGWLLLVYGVAIALGNMIGGKVANINPARVLIRLFMLQALVLLLFTFTVHYQAPAVITLFAMGLLSFANVPGLQLYIVQLAEKYLPGTEDISSSLNISAFNLGVAIGAYVGGFVVDHAALGLGATPWIGALIVLLGGVLTVYSYRRNGEVKE